MNPEEKTAADKLRRKLAGKPEPEPEPSTLRRRTDAAGRGPRQDEKSATEALRRRLEVQHALPEASPLSFAKRRALDDAARRVMGRRDESLDESERSMMIDEILRIDRADDPVLLAKHSSAYIAAVFSGAQSREAILRLRAKGSQ